MSKKDLESSFKDSLLQTIQTIMEDQSFDILSYVRKYNSIINEESLILKEMEILVDKFKVPQEELGVELDDPVMESCFCCDSIFETTDINVVKVPFCHHRAHLECVRKLAHPYCTFCGNGIRTSLLSFLKSEKLSQLALEQVSAQTELADGNTPDIRISEIPHDPMKLGASNGDYSAIQ